VDKTSSLSNIIENLERDIREGNTLCVLGWKSSNHNTFTRSLDKADCVVFADLSGNNNLKPLPDKAVVIVTKFVSHKHSNLLKTGRVRHHPHPLPLGDIRKILLALKPVLMGEPAPKQVNPQHTAVTNIDQESPTLEELEQRVLSGGRAPDKYDRFAAAFTKKAAEHPEKLVGTRTLGELIAQLELAEKPPVLVSKGLVIAVVQAGKKRIGWYKAGPELEKRLQQSISEEPTDPLDKAAWLLEQEPEFRRKLAELSVQITFWETHLRRVDAAKELLRQIEAL
jgi:hypothetical protein